MADKDKLGMAQEWETTPAAEEKPVTPAPPAQKFFREIDLGDGSGAQRFEADSYEALVDKFVEAQTHASRTIHKLQRDYKEVTAGSKQRQPEKQSTDYQELKPSTVKVEELVQFQNNPHELFRRTFQAETGMTPEEFRVRENNRRRQEAEMEAQQAFVQKHAEEYTPTPENAQRIMRFLQKENLPISKANLDYAFGELRAELVSKPQPQIARPTVTGEAEKPAQQEKISPPPSFLRPSLGGRGQVESEGGIDAVEVARIAQLPPGEMKARIEQIFRQSRTTR